MGTDQTKQNRMDQVTGTRNEGCGKQPYVFKIVLVVTRSPRAQADSARWTPVDARSEGGGDRVTVVEVVCT